MEEVRTLASRGGGVRLPGSTSVTSQKFAEKVSSLPQRHARESGHPEVFDFPGFRLSRAAARSAGMTSELGNEADFISDVNFSAALTRNHCHRKGWLFLPKNPRQRRQNRQVSLSLGLPLSRGIAA